MEQTRREDITEKEQRLDALSPSARASPLDLLLARGALGPSQLCSAELDATGLRLLGLSPPSSASTEAATTCLVSLQGVAGLPRAQGEGRRACLRVSRLCLWDGAKFMGNCQAVSPRSMQRGAGQSGDTWRFRRAPLLLRCPTRALPRAQLYIEFNAELEAAEAGVGQQELEGGAPRARPPLGKLRRPAGGEVTLAWALLDLSTLGTLAETRTLCLPLRRGSLPRPALLEAAPGRRCCWGGLLGCGRGPRATLTLGPLPTRAAGAAALLPPAAIADGALALVASLYRQLLAEALAAASPRGGPVPALADAELAALPLILDDPDLCPAFFTLWEKQQAPRPRRRQQPAPTAAELRSALRRCTAAVAPLLRVTSLPAAAGSGRRGRAARRQAVGEYMGGNCMAALQSQRWAHAPLDAAELRCTPVPQLTRPTV